jgi:Tol biopolymer transport system component
MALAGEPYTIAENVRSGGVNGRNAFTVSEGGLLAYRAGAAEFQVKWYTRDGKPGATVMAAEDFGSLSLSPDDTRLIVAQGTGTERDLWVKELASGVYARLTSAVGLEQDAVWSPDSRRVAYMHFAGNRRSWYHTTIGSGSHDEFQGDPAQTALEDWTPDGQLVFRGAGPGTISIVPAPDQDASQQASTPRTILNERYVVDHVRVSPNGKWVAYTSVESGRPQVHLASFPSFNDRRQISVGAGMQPTWRADGRELFFLGVDQRLMAVDIDADATLRVGSIKPLFQTAVSTTISVHNYAPTSDGQRFLLREPQDSAAVEQLYVVTNWLSLVREDKR